MKVRKGDTVLVNTGRDRGLTGQVISVFPKLNKIAVNGINIIKKAVKPSKANPTGGFIEKNGLINISNVTLLDDKQQVAKVSYKIEDNKKTRILTPKLTKTSVKSEKTSSKAKAVKETSVAKSSKDSK